MNSCDLLLSGVRSGYWMWIRPTSRTGTLPADVGPKSGRLTPKLFCCQCCHIGAMATTVVAIRIQRFNKNWLPWQHGHISSQAFHQFQLHKGKANEKDHIHCKVVSSSTTKLTWQFASISPLSAWMMIFIWLWRRKISFCLDFTRWKPIIVTIEEFKSTWQQHQTADQIYAYHYKVVLCFTKTLIILLGDGCRLATVSTIIILTHSCLRMGEIEANNTL
jgi:hypothetical protein